MQIFSKARIRRLQSDKISLCHAIRSIEGCKVIKISLCHFGFRHRLISKQGACISHCRYYGLLTQSTNTNRIQHCQVSQESTPDSSCKVSQESTQYSSTCFSIFHTLHMFHKKVPKIPTLPSITSADFTQNKCRFENVIEKNADFY